VVVWGKRENGTEPVLPGHGAGAGAWERLHLGGSRRGEARRGGEAVSRRGEAREPGRERSPGEAGEAREGLGGEPPGRLARGGGEARREAKPGAGAGSSPGAWAGAPARWRAKP